MGLTLTEKAIIDLEEQKEAMARRAKNFDAIGGGQRAREGDSPLPDDYINALAAPVQIKLTFEHPVDTRRQIETLQAKLVEALVVTQDHGRGINRQRLDLRGIIKEAADILTMMQGKKPDRRVRQRKPI